MQHSLLISLFLAASVLPAALSSCSSPASQAGPDASNVEVSVASPDAASGPAFDAGIQPFSPPNKTPPDAGNPWCQLLQCYDVQILLPECATECTLLPPDEQHLIVGPQCQDCANPVDVTNCGAYCVETSEQDGG